MCKSIRGVNKPWQSLPQGCDRRVSLGMLSILPEQTPSAGSLRPVPTEGLLQHPRQLLIEGRGDAGTGSAAADAFQGFVPNQETFSCREGCKVGHKPKYTQTHTVHKTTVCFPSNW